jgi:hypothetical protein
MRHATDPDHVIAVTTIVSNQGNRLRAVLIGAFWGVGHTVTIFVVGAAIILFNPVIPVRVGLSMELSVAVMLIIGEFTFQQPAQILARNSRELAVRSDRLNFQGFHLQSSFSRLIFRDRGASHLPSYRFNPAGSKIY